VTGAGGISLFNDADSSAAGTTITGSYDPGFAFVAGGGRQFDFGLRVEGEVGYRQASVDSVKLGGVGSANASGNTSALSFMINGLYDFNNIGYDLGPKFKPYVGAGIGFANVSANNIKVLNTTILDDSDVVFTYQAIGGISYEVMPKTTMFLEYRYFATTDPKLSAPGGGSVKSEFQSNNIMIGARYAF
jgi:OmpA-OmpF porin, OOP family